MYALLGASGNITSKAVKRLLERGEEVRVIGRNGSHLEPLGREGAEIAVGDARDAGFLSGAFRGARAVYAMIPPDYAAPDHRQYQNAVGEAIARAIVDAGVRSIVSLSSVGAALPGGTGPIAGLHDQEWRLDGLGGVAVLHMRAGYFMENHLHAIPAIRAAGVYPAMIAPDVPVAMVATQDVAEAVVDALVGRPLEGHSVRHLLGPRSYTMTEAARILGAAIGRPDLEYVQAEPGPAKAAMIQAGFSPNVADLFEEMSRALSDGRVNATFKRDAASSTPTSLEVFAPVFARAYEAGGAH